MTLRADPPDDRRRQVFPLPELDLPPALGGVAGENDLTETLARPSQHLV